MLSTNFTFILAMFRILFRCQCIFTNNPGLSTNLSYSCPSNIYEFISLLFNCHNPLFMSFYCLMSISRFIQLLFPYYSGFRLMWAPVNVGSRIMWTFYQGRIHFYITCTILLRLIWAIIRLMWTNQF